MNKLSTARYYKCTDCIRLKWQATKTPCYLKTDGNIRFFRDHDTTEWYPIKDLDYGCSSSTFKRLKYNDYVLEML